MLTPHREVAELRDILKEHGYELPPSAYSRCIETHGEIPFSSTDLFKLPEFDRRNTEIRRASGITSTSNTPHSHIVSNSHPYSTSQRQRSRDAMPPPPRPLTTDHFAPLSRGPTGTKVSPVIDRTPAEAQPFHWSTHREMDAKGTFSHLTHPTTEQRSKKDGYSYMVEGSRSPPKRQPQTPVSNVFDSGEFEDERPVTSERLVSHKPHIIEETLGRPVSRYGLREDARCGLNELATSSLMAGDTLKDDRSWFLSASNSGCTLGEEHAFPGYLVTDVDRIVQQNRTPISRRCQPSPQAFEVFEEQSPAVNRRRRVHDIPSSSRRLNRPFIPPTLLRTDSTYNNLSSAVMVRGPPNQVDNPDISKVPVVVPRPLNYGRREIPVVNGTLVAAGLRHTKSVPSQLRKTPFTPMHRTRLSSQSGTAQSTIGNGLSSLSSHSPVISRPYSSMTDMIKSGHQPARLSPFKSPAQAQLQHFGPSSAFISRINARPQSVTSPFFEGGNGPVPDSLSRQPEFREQVVALPRLGQVRSEVSLGTRMGQRLTRSPDRPHPARGGPIQSGMILDPRLGNQNSGRQTPTPNSGRQAPRLNYDSPNRPRAFSSTVVNPTITGRIIQTRAVPSRPETTSFRGLADYLYDLPVPGGASRTPSTARTTASSVFGNANISAPAVASSRRSVRR
jgi:hypothetical protein